LLCGDKPEWDSPVAVTEDRSENSADTERITRLEEEMSALRKEMADLKDEVARFRRQFE
jgi:predicted nuclease with TOPRIM domain